MLECVHASELVTTAGLAAFLCGLSSLWGFLHPQFRLVYIGYGGLTFPTTTLRGYSLGDTKILR